MSVTVMSDQNMETEEEKLARAKRLRSKNMAVGFTILGIIVLLYLVSYVRISTL